MKYRGYPYENKKIKLKKHLKKYRRRSDRNY